MDANYSGRRSSRPRRRPSKDEYAVGWVSALPRELKAALACLDEQHETLPRDKNDYNEYAFGRIHEHNVVLACLPSGTYGTNSAANVAVHMRRSFPSIRFLLMVGIAGGIPFPADVRLGDVVVGQDIVQHDLGKDVKGDEFVSTAPKHVLHSSLATTPARVQAELRPGWHRSIVSKMRHSRGLQNPHLDRTKLFDGLYHAKPVVHYGTIASGNQVVKNARKRDEIGLLHNALCIEMEAAGLDHDFPNLVIRGVCDYADSHKKKEWQDYAAATAAAFAKRFLRKRAPESWSTALSATAVAKHPALSAELAAHRKECLKSLSFDQIDSRYEDINERHEETCLWILQHEAYLDWLDPTRHHVHHGFLWLRGNAGVGKSTIMKYLFETSRDIVVVLAFFFNARGGELEKSAVGMYRSFLFQLLKELPELQATLDNQRNTSWTLKKLQRLMSQAIGMLSTRHLMLFIDALDECNAHEGLAMVESFQREARHAFEKGVKLHICFSSRPYPVVSMRKGILVVLDEQEGDASDLERYVRSSLSQWPRGIRQDLRHKIIEKAQGIFLWAVLVLSLLYRDFGEGRVDSVRLHERLQGLPVQLSDLFREILRKDSHDLESFRLCAQWIIYARRPLSPKEFYRAMMMGISPESNEVYGPWDKSRVTYEVVNNFITSTSRGLAKITNTHWSQVEFIHESVKDFLINENGMCELFGPQESEPAHCHERIKQLCYSFFRKTTGDYIPSTRSRGRFGPNSEAPFVEYVATSMLHHAEWSATENSQVQFLTNL
ncbi:uncharacterized protein B0I36DRAFT_240326, partial [Microdochium trichocladiopsis]